LSKKLHRKHPQIEISVDRLYLDPDNPRLPEDAQGKSESELMKYLYRGFNLDELVNSMSQNGYFQEEPLVVIPQKLSKELKREDVCSKKFADYINDEKTKFTVVEGNRRLASAKFITSQEIRNSLKIKHWKDPSTQIIESLRYLPAIIYRDRSEIIPYLGVRHIVGIQKWGSYAKASAVSKKLV